MKERERNNKLMPIVSKTKSVYNSGIFEIKNNNLEEGIECFSQWLSIEEGNSEDSNKNVQLTLIVFEKKNNKLLLHDNLHNSDIEIVFTDGVHSVLYAGLMIVHIQVLLYVQNKIFKIL